MGNNLPPLSSAQRRRAPWNQGHEHPEDRCRFCGAGLGRLGRVTREIDLTTHLVEWQCPGCDRVVVAKRYDFTEEFLKSWREYPEEMEATIDDYSELREAGK